MPVGVVIGDSLARGMSSGAWAGVLLSRLDVRVGEENYKQFADNDQPTEVNKAWGRFAWTIYNAGVTGNDTSEMLARFSDDVLALAPDKCLILGGMNDYGAGITPSQTLQNLDSMVELCLANDIEPCICTVTPATLSTALSDNVDAINTLIYSYATANNVRLADFYSALGGKGSATYLDGSLYHPTAAGKLLMGAAVPITGWEAYAQPRIQPAGLGEACVADWLVNADGTLVERIDKSLPTWVLGSSLGSPRAIGETRGTFGDLTSGVRILLPTTGWSVSGGEILAVFAPPWLISDSVEHNILTLEGTDGSGNVNNYFKLYKQGANSLRFDFNGADGVGATPTMAASWTVNTVHVVGAYWDAATGKCACSFDGVAGTGLTTDAMVSVRSTAVLGCNKAYTSGSYLAAPFQRIAIFNRKLTAYERLDVSLGMLDGPMLNAVTRKTPICIGGGLSW